VQIIVMAEALSIQDLTRPMLSFSDPILELEDDMLSMELRRIDLYASA